MIFLWPEMLALLLAVPTLIALYIVLLRRRAKQAVRYASLTTVKEAMGTRERVRRHIPPFLLLLALTLIILATARPAAILTLPSHSGTVILALDVSVSMRAQDVAPNRMEAAKSAVRHFIEERPANTRVGIVSFAADATLLQAPTSNRQELLDTLKRIDLQAGTAVGSGILVSLQTIFPDAKLEPAPRSSKRGFATQNERRGTSLDVDPNTAGPEPKRVPPGSYDSAVIILLTDGQTTTGPDPVEAARMAAQRGVRIYTVGMGTSGGELILGDNWSVRVSLDEKSLKQIASETKGEYFYADNATDLAKVYNMLNSKLIMERKETEVSALFTAAAALLALLAATLSVVWHGRMQ
jgi:Ca-activated chloride channel family protein